MSISSDSDFSRDHELNLGFIEFSSSHSSDSSYISTSGLVSSLNDRASQSRPNKKNNHSVHVIFEAPMEDEMMASSHLEAFRKNKRAREGTRGENEENAGRLGRKSKPKAARKLEQSGPVLRSKNKYEQPSDEDYSFN